MPRFVLSRGKTVVDEHGLHTVEGSGQFVAREPFQSVSKALSTWKKTIAPRKVERTGLPQSGV
jgi:dihydropyrimidinase